MLQSVRSFFSQGRPIPVVAPESNFSDGTAFIRRTQLGVDMYFKCARKFGFPEGVDAKGGEQYTGPKERYQTIYGRCELGPVTVDVSRKSIGPHFRIDVDVPEEERKISIVTRAGFQHFGSGTVYFRDLVKGQPKVRPGTVSLHSVSQMLDRILDTFQLERVESGRVPLPRD